MVAVLLCAALPCHAAEVTLEPAELAAYIAIPVVLFVSALVAALVLWRRYRLLARAGDLQPPATIAQLKKDLTASRRSISRLEELRSELDYLLASIWEGVIVCGTDGVVRWMNARAEALTGVSLAEAVRKPLGEVLRVVDEHGGNPVELRLTEDGGTPVPRGMSALVVPPKGSPVPVELSVFRPPEDRVVKPIVAVVIRDVADKSSAQDELAKMVQSYLGMAATMQKALGGSSADSGAFHQNIGYLYLLRGSYRDALEHYQKALQIREREYGATHRVTAASYNDIGRVYLTSGDANAALGYFDRALSIWSQSPGAVSPETADCYHSLGNAHHARGEMRAALENHAKALGIREATFGPDHLATAASCMSIGHVHWDLGAYAEAKQSYARALMVRLANVGKEHAQTGHAFLCLGACCVLLGLHDEAEGHLTQALESLRAALGAEHPITANAAAWVAQLYDLSGQRDKARESRRAALFTNPLNKRYG